jgi:predicted acylesterase/phospholipase RssA
VLKRLEELRILPLTEILSCVSGGSIVGALYALRCAERGTGVPGSFPVDKLIHEMRPILTGNLRGRALFGTLARSWRTARSLGSVRTSRIGLIADELDAALYEGSALSRLPAWVVLNATSLRTGKAWKFYADCAGDYLMGATDDTASIRVADAVAASAAYPGLADAYPFRTCWERLKPELLVSHRWERPPVQDASDMSGWRRRFGRSNGPVTIPLVDGGVYDNEGLNGLRSAGITHAILSSTVMPEDDASQSMGMLGFLRVIRVMHARLGAVTRQLAHEMTHQVEPARARLELLEVTQELRKLATAASDAPAQQTLEALAVRTSCVASVGLPPRGRQFIASAPILLNRLDLAADAPTPGPFDNLVVAPECRGLSVHLIEELARVRTDLDAFDPQTVTLLMSQGYLLTDAYVKLCMPDLVGLATGVTDILDERLRPIWEPALQAIASSNRDSTDTLAALMNERAARNIVERILGRCADTDERRRHVRHASTMLALALLAIPIALVVTAFALLAMGVVTAAGVGVAWAVYGPRLMAQAQHRAAAAPAQTTNQEHL